MGLTVVGVSVVGSCENEANSQGFWWVACDSATFNNATIFAMHAGQSLEYITVVQVPSPMAGTAAFAMEYILCEYEERPRFKYQGVAIDERDTVNTVSIKIDSGALYRIRRNEASLSRRAHLERISTRAIVKTEAFIKSIAT